ncbi:MAG TPA: acyltransferase family protein [Anaerolineae bacterium]|nr:acyltransferase family protein [Anaerolineae bacterium]
MASETVIPGLQQSPPAAPIPAKGSSRLLFVDNIRIFLTIVVILHHLMIIYAGSGGWIFHEGREDEITNALGSWFCNVNQAYFMGLFLLISAYFVPGSYDRKGPVRFVVDRLVRLGIPLAVYSWILRPLFIYIVLNRGEGLPFGGWYETAYFRLYGLLGGGPLWFIELLLLFSLVYATAHLFTSWRLPRPAPEARFPSSGWVALFALLVGLVTFLVRLGFHVNTRFEPLNFQFANFTQYIALFVAGLVAYRRNWLLSLPDRVGRLWLWIAVVLILIFPPMALLAGAENDEPFLGGWYWQSMLYAQWEALLCVSMCIGLIYLFRRRRDRQGPVARELSRAAYGAYLIHEPVITALAVVTAGVALYPLLKFALAAVASVPLCFALAALIRKLPYFDRVL